MHWNTSRFNSCENKYKYYAQVNLLKLRYLVSVSGRYVHFESRKEDNELSLKLKKALIGGDFFPFIVSI